MAAMGRFYGWVSHVVLYSSVLLCMAQALQMQCRWKALVVVTQLWLCGLRRVLSRAGALLCALVWELAIPCRIQTVEQIYPRQADLIQCQHGLQQRFFPTVKCRSASRKATAKIYTTNG